jgi:hypothetical protein
MFTTKQSHVHFSYFICVLFFALLVSIPSVGHAEVARMEIHSFQSVTLTDKQFLMGEKNGKPVTIAGELRIPRPGNDRLPVVILLHGSSGLGGYDRSVY